MQLWKMVPGGVGWKKEEHKSYGEMCLSKPFAVQVMELAIANSKTEEVWWLVFSETEERAFEKIAGLVTLDAIALISGLMHSLESSFAAGPMPFGTYVPEEGLRYMATSKHMRLAIQLGFRKMPE